MLEMNKAYLMDCMEGMAQFPDGFFDLAVVDPPYGTGGVNRQRMAPGLEGGLTVTRTGGRWAKKYEKK